MTQPRLIRNSGGETLPLFLITDIDDVICDAQWRKDIQGFDDYHACSLQDKPHSHIIAMINAMHSAGIKIWAMTGRPEKWRQITNTWLLKHGVLIDNLVMRPEKNFMTSPDLKLHFLSLLQQPESELLILEDRDDVVVALRGAGYNVMQVFNQRQK